MDTSEPLNTSPQQNQINEEIESYKRKIQVLTNENYNLRRCLIRSRKKVFEYEHGNVPQSLALKIVKSKLKDRFTEPQIDIMCSETPRKFSKKMGTAELGQALKFRNLGVKVLDEVRKTVPLPSNSTVQILDCHLS